MACDAGDDGKQGGLNLGPGGEFGGGLGLLCSESGQDVVDQVLDGDGVLLHQRFFFDAEVVGELHIDFHKINAHINRLTVFICGVQWWSGKMPGLRMARFVFGAIYYLRSELEPLEMVMPG